MIYRYTNAYPFIEGTERQNQPAINRWNLWAPTDRIRVVSHPTEFSLVGKWPLHQQNISNFYSTYIIIYIYLLFFFCELPNIYYIVFLLWTTKDYRRHFACSIVDVGSTIQKLASHDLSVDMPSCLGIHHLKKSSCRLRPWVTRFCTPACRMMAWRREG